MVVQKVHKLPSVDHSYTECGKDTLGSGYFRVKWYTRWRGVTCKNCLKKKT